MKNMYSPKVVGSRLEFAGRLAGQLLRPILKTDGLFVGLGDGAEILSYVPLDSLGDRGETHG